MRRLPALAVLLLAACTTGRPPPPPAEDTCGGADLQGLVGQSAAVLETMRFSQPLRVVRPGIAVTMDYRGDRLNIEVDAAELIVRVTCG